jgi:polyisoprenoid-binding protein YceI
MTRFALVVPILAATWLGSSALALPETYKIDSAKSAIAFSVHQFFNVTHGKFTQFAGTVQIDRENPERSSVTARIQVRSLDTGIRKRDEHLLSAEFFNASKFPEITFQSRKVKRTGDQSGDVAGELTMHGITRLVVLHVRLLTSAPNTEAMEHTRWGVTTEPMKRRDFNLLFSGTAEAVSGISQDVSPIIEIEATKVE